MRREFAYAVAAVLAFDGSDATAQDAVALIVSNYDQAWEYVVHPATGSASFVSTSVKSPDQKYHDALGKSLRELGQKKVKRGLVVTTALPASAKWAEFSPDCKRVLIGYKHPEFDVIDDVAYGHAEPWSQTGSMRLRGGKFIQDLAWSPDSRYLLVIETEERYSKRPRDLLSGMSGHPVPLETLYLTTIDMESNKKSRSKLMSDVRYGTAVFSSTQPTCRRP